MFALCYELNKWFVISSNQWSRVRDKKRSASHDIYISPSPRPLPNMSSESSHIYMLIHIDSIKATKLPITRESKHFDDGVESLSADYKWAHVVPAPLLRTVGVGIPDDGDPATTIIHVSHGVDLDELYDEMLNQVKAEADPIVNVMAGGVGVCWLPVGFMGNAHKSALVNLGSPTRTVGRGVSRTGQYCLPQVPPHVCSHALPH
jgi:hypothetical protein